MAQLRRSCDMQMMTVHMCPATGGRRVAGSEARGDRPCDLATHGAALANALGVCEPVGIFQAGSECTFAFAPSL
jgi:hypothetical protein